MSPLMVKFGIPQPEKTTQPRFKAEGITTLSLDQFPANIMPSGGLSGVVSSSEMYMVKTYLMGRIVPTQMTWKDSVGKVIGTMSGTWSMIGRYPWEITLPGIYDVDIRYKGIDIGTVSFEVT